MSPNLTLFLYKILIFRYFMLLIDVLQGFWWIKLFHSHPELLCENTERELHHWPYFLIFTISVLSLFTQNSTRPPLKLSNVERITNFQILVLFGCLLAISLVCSIGQTIWKYQYGNDAWYMDLNCKSPNSPCCTSYSTYFVSLVHISLFRCHFEFLKCWYVLCRFYVASVKLCFALQVKYVAMWE